jgi:hypothetical protein
MSLFFMCEWFVRVYIVIGDDAIACLKAVVRSARTPLRYVRLHSRFFSTPLPLHFSRAMISPHIYSSRSHEINCSFVGRGSSLQGKNSIRSLAPTSPHSRPKAKPAVHYAPRGILAYPVVRLEVRHLLCCLVSASLNGKASNTILTQRCTRLF